METVPLIQNDIETLLRFYNRCSEQEDKIIETVVENYVRSRLGYAFVNWNERQRENILKQFEYILSRQQLLRDDIHRYYMTRIQVCQDLDMKCSLTAEYTGIVRMMWMKPPVWLETLEMNLPYIRDISPTDTMIPIFNRILKRIKSTYLCESECGCGCGKVL